MLETDDGYSDVVQTGEARRRLANVISVLLPAREYRLECAWTTERPLPAVEEFACKLILVMDGVSPSELGGYFGLSALELDGLVSNLVKNRLVEVADDGTLQPSVMLQAKGLTPDEVPTFTNFETREESAVFDLLALQLVPRRSYTNARFGLPEVPMPDAARSVSPDRIAEAFSEQYRAFLEFARGRTRETFKTRLYKVSSCRARRTLQVPVDMEIWLDASANGELNIYRDAVERLGESQRRPLSTELESCVADYLSQEFLPESSLSAEGYCTLVGDDVLARYANGETLELGRWLADRDAKKTGYGSPDTRALLGPIYLGSNRKTLTNLLKQSEGDDSSQAAHWLPASCPFWAANSSELVDFVPRFERALAHEGNGRLVACFCDSDTLSQKHLKRTFFGRVPNAVLFSGNVALNRMELLVVPGRLVVAQYHLQPSKTSAITLPIGFVSTDPERIAKVTGLLTDRLAASASASVMWSAGSQQIHHLIDFDGLGLIPPGRPEARREIKNGGKATISNGKIVWSQSTQP